MKKIITSLLILGAIMALSSCSSVPDVALSSDYWTQQPQAKVAIATTTKPQPTLMQEGDQGIADIAVADIVTSQFSTYLSSFSINSFYSINNEIAKKLHEKNIKTVAFNQAIDIDHLQKSGQNAANYATKNYTAYANQLKDDTLLVINIDYVGAERPYYAFIPLGAPKAVCAATGRLIKPKTNAILWRKSTIIQVPVDGKWDQPPSYPQFTKALNQAIKQAKQVLFDDFTLQAGS